MACHEGAFGLPCAGESRSLCQQNAKCAQRTSIQKIAPRYRGRRLRWSVAQPVKRSTVVTDQRFFLFAAPPFQLMLARDGACCRWVLLSVDHSHGPSVRGVYRSTSLVVRLFSRREV